MSYGERWRRRTQRSLNGPPHHTSWPVFSTDRRASVHAEDCHQGESAHDLSPDVMATFRRSIRKTSSSPVAQEFRKKKRTPVDHPVRRQLRILAEDCLGHESQTELPSKISVSANSSNGFSLTSIRLFASRPGDTGQGSEVTHSSHN